MKKIIKISLMIFLIIQPLLDIYLLYTDTVINFIGFSPSTILRMVTVFILVILVLLTIKFNQKYWWFISYGIVLIVYFILHHLNGLAFDYNPTGTYNYNLTEEIFYITRMILPLAVAFITYHVNFTKENIRKVFFLISLIISSFIIVTNLLCLSLPSYGDNSEFITSNIFSWFTKEGIVSSVDISSRGLFMSANQVAALLTMLLPIIIYYVFYKKSNKYLVALFFQIVALLMLGTRISSYVWIIIMILMFIIYLFLVCIKKELTFNKVVSIKYGIIFILLIILLQFAPITHRLFADDYVGDAVYMTDEEYIEISDLSLNDKSAFIYNNYEAYHLNKSFVIDIYNYESHQNFWIDVMYKDFWDRADNRKIETHIMSDIYENNNNSLDKFFGMSASVFRSGGFYLEHDFLAQFYSLGIIGSLLLVWPYILILILGIYKLLKKYREKFNFVNISYLFSLGLMVVISMITGSVIEQLFITLIGGFIIGLLYNNLINKNIKKM